MHFNAFGILKPNIKFKFSLLNFDKPNYTKCLKQLHKNQLILAIFALQTLQEIYCQIIITSETYHPALKCEKFGFNKIQYTWLSMPFQAFPVGRS